MHLEGSARDCQSDEQLARALLPTLGGYCFPGVTWESAHNSGDAQKILVHFCPPTQLHPSPAQREPEATRSAIRRGNAWVHSFGQQSFWGACSVSGTTLDTEKEKRPNQHGFRSSETHSWAQETHTWAQE